MKSAKKTEKSEQLSNEVELDGSGSVDDFIRELEAKEKDLHISSELVIEVSESDFDDTNIPDFVKEELVDRAKSIEFSIPKVSGSGARSLEITELEKTIARFKAERSEILERGKRQTEEFENFKNRMERERRETFINQMANLATQMLPVLDNLNRALDFGLAMSEEKRAEIEQFFDGIVLVNQQVNEVLAGMGVQPILTVGEEFDPHFHEAVATEETDKRPHNTVSEEMLRGYRIGPRVIRHSMVKVASNKSSAVPGKPSESEIEAVSDDLDLLQED